jgi:outer membrane protein assembly factor BamB
MRLLALGLTWLVFPGVIASALAGSQWSGFRGDGSSVTTARDLPLQWSETNNIAWRIQLPGTGQSSPIIWNDRIYVTSVEGPRKEKLVVQALSLAEGKEVWRFAVDSSVPEELSNMRSHAAPTPVAEGDGVFAFFESGDCIALTHDGKARWRRNVLEMTAKVSSNHGLGGSPILFERGLYLPLDQAGPACLLALDRTTGSTLWKAARVDKTSWSTPVVARRGDEFLIILSGGGTIAGYDAEIGTLSFEVTGIVKNSVPSPTVSGNLLVIGASSKGSNLALDLSKGKASVPPELWRSGSATCGFASPLVHRGRAYFVSSAGIISCLNATNGELLFEERLSEGAWASSIGAGDHIFIFGEKGTTTVLAAQDEFKILGTNRLAFSKNVPGVAVTDGGFIIRAGNDLVLVGGEKTVMKTP